VAVLHPSAARRRPHRPSYGRHRRAHDEPAASPCFSDVSGCIDGRLELARRQRRLWPPARPIGYGCIYGCIIGCVSGCIDGRLARRQRRPWLPARPFSFGFGCIYGCITGCIFGCIDGRLARRHAQRRPWPPARPFSVSLGCIDGRPAR
jgi:hypothetical protein